MKRERRAICQGLDKSAAEEYGVVVEDEEEEDNGELRPRKDVKIVAVDLQPIARLEGITTIIADITHPSTISRILQALDPETYDESASTGSHPVDLVISDGAPDVTGLHDLDIYIQSQLLYSALNLAIKVLKPGATFVAKIFRGKDVDFIYAQLRCFFERVSCAKPRSSRASSLEAFVVCEGFSIPKNFKVDEMLPLGIGGHISMPKPSTIKAKTENEGGFVDGQKRFTRTDGITVLEFEDSDDESTDDRWIAPFVACGDLSAWDADATYQLPKDHVSLDPVRPPMNPPYKKALEERRKRGGLYGKTKK